MYWAPCAKECSLIFRHWRYVRQDIGFAAGGTIETKTSSARLHPARVHSLPQPCYPPAEIACLFVVVVFCDFERARVFFLFFFILFCAFPTFRCIHAFEVINI